ncbi:DMT family transporter [Pseudonocardia sp. RS11V-5]|uniref:DMT family transporter n=1 Tax=Pseudonocardia terrae TaxID=2905831 RepID=UPI001E44487A|nr:DMT family transporter [Pseudonocardia terrae]MCE3555200.1 DMT family transporter [Pseudonocardia terrae]
MTGLAIGLAAGAGLAAAAGDVLQRSSARHETSDPHESVRLLVRLLRRPRWLLGVLVSLAGLVSHITALSLGRIASVQPLLVTELPLAVLGSALFLGGRLGWRDWAGVVLLAASLGGFVALLDPGGGQPLDVPGSVWAIGAGVLLAVMTGLAVAGWRTGGETRAALLGVASGVGYGLTGALFAGAGRRIAHLGPAAALTTWQTYAAVAAGLVSFYLLQNALAAGSLVAVEPGTTLTNPIVAVVWGVVVFGETTATGARLAGALGCAALIVVGVFVLARSPALQSHATPS